MSITSLKFNSLTENLKISPSKRRCLLDTIIFQIPRKNFGGVFLWKQTGSCFSSTPPTPCVVHGVLSPLQQVCLQSMPNGSDSGHLDSCHQGGRPPKIPTKATDAIWVTNGIFTYIFFWLISMVLNVGIYTIIPWILWEMEIPFWWGIFPP